MMPGHELKALAQAKRGQDAFRPHDRFAARSQDQEVFGEKEEVNLKIKSVIKIVIP